MIGGLRELLTTTISKTSTVTDRHDAWDTPPTQSPAGKELAAEEARRPPPQTGSWPWLLAPIIARWALQAAAEQAKGFCATLEPGATSFAADVLSRAVLESSSLAWWLLDPGINAQARSARSLLYRLQGAAQTQRTIKALDLGPDDADSEYGELPEAVQNDINSAGLTCERRNHSGRQALFCGGQSWLGYTARATSLIAELWPQSKLPYRALSAVAHGDLLGLQRNLVRSPDTQSLQVAPSPATALWLWHDAYLVTGALAFTTSRAAAFIGLDSQLIDLHAWTTELDQRLPALRPNAP